MEKRRRKEIEVISLSQHSDQSKFDEFLRIWGPLSVEIDDRTLEIWGEVSPTAVKAILNTILQSNKAKWKKGDKKQSKCLPSVPEAESAASS